MYNDEIEEVRLKAIDCMTKISQLIILREDQLEIILGVLEAFKLQIRTMYFFHLCNVKLNFLQDSNVEIREGLHRMLGACRLSTKSCVKICVKALLDNLKRYQQVFVCLFLF